MIHLFAVAPPLLAWLLASAAPPSKAPMSIPVNFRGEWNSELRYCGTHQNDTLLILAAREVTFYASRGTVLGAIPAGPNHLNLYFLIQNDPSLRLYHRKYRLSVDQTMLIDITGNHEGIARYRCPTIKMHGILPKAALETPRIHLRSKRIFSPMHVPNK